MSTELPGPLHALSSVLNHYGYAAVVGLVGVEGVGIPAPGQTILIAAGVYAGAGQLNLIAVLLLGLLAAVAGDNLGYAVGHYGGRPLVQRVGRYVFLNEERLDSAERFFDRHGPIVVVVARSIDGLRQFNGVVAGVSRMRWWRFLIFNAVGGMAWVLVWVLLGYLAGAHLGTIYAEVRRYQSYLLIALGVVVTAVVTWSLLRRRRQRRD
jgi:membrane protein DedA with SNARE-associated domain